MSNSPMDTTSSHLMSTPVASKRRREDRVNPFEKHLLDRLHQPFWSPSILSTGDSLMETPPQTSWGIKEMSLLNPIKIEESPSTHQNETILDEKSEADAQAKIEKFFSRTEPIAPSPIMSLSSINEKSTNTDISFPPYLPPDFEQFLNSYNSCRNEGSNSRSEELNSSIKRRKLDFTFESGPENDSEDDLISINIENSNGKTINSPSDENSGVNFEKSAFVRSEDFGVDMASPASTPIRRLVR